ncbi:SH3 domain-containing protein [Chitinophaga polysaccharea]|uniref:SH3 domain-containing protein n=1 Tax=Chitinophaga polysaccharea TaxID=1293035 RepID=A0A561PM81_9BACT|nr:DUF4236 domain-containing protein [Chitinophaga polysaccharea]TWF39188.1 SH3 domain-containing protein [Chitinophaga polysaccharea]
MGWSYRKSFSAGPFRINFSKKGISYSMGVKGARINVGPGGTYVNLSTHGISYRQKISGPASPLPRPVYEVQPVDTANNITSAAVEELTDTDSLAFITELNQKCAKISYARVAKLPLLIIPLIVLFFSFGKRDRIVQPAVDSTIVIIRTFNGANIRKEPNRKSPVLQTADYGQKFALQDSSNQQWLKVRLSDSSGYVNRELVEINQLFSEEVREGETYLVNEYLGYEIALYMLCLIPFIRWLKKLDMQRLSIELHYDMDDKYRQVYQQFKTHFVTFSRSSRIWQYLNAQGTADYKRNGGAGKLIRRVRIAGLSENKMPVPYFVANVAIPCISLHKMELYFLPERLLIKRGSTFAAVFYKNLHITGLVSNFIESEMLPQDAQVVSYTWQYVNKAGGPDKRFNHNRRLPVCAYSEYTFTSGTGIFEIIATSKLSAMDDFMDFIGKIGVLQSRVEGCYQ